MSETPPPTEAYPWLIKQFGLAPREAQGQLVSKLITGEGVLAIEAPTATGKSHGALLGLSLRLREAKRRGHASARAVLATYSNPLRLQYDELVEDPTLKRLFPELTYFSVAGASNYVCLHQAREALQDQDWSNRARAEQELKFACQAVSEEPKDSIIGLEELFPSTVRSWFKASAEACNDRPECAEGHCGFRLAREQAKQADIVVTNHALFTLNALYGNRILGEFNAAVLDEGHQYGQALRGALSEVVRGSQLTSPRASAVLPTAFEQLENLAELLQQLKPAVANWELERLVEQQLSPSPRWIGEGQAASVRENLKQQSIALQRQALSAKDRLEFELDEHLSAQHAGKLNPRCDDCRLSSSQLRHARELLRRLTALRTWEQVCTPTFDEYRSQVGTATLRQRGRGARAKTEVELHLEVVELNEYTATVQNSVELLALMSATIGSASDESYALTEVGLEVSEPVLRLKSPLDYSRMDVLLDTRPSSISVRERLLDAMFNYGYAGSALVLCGSHSLKRQLAAVLEAARRQGMHPGSVIVQPQSGSSGEERAAMFKKFKQEEKSSLIGTKSYYEGVNAPGKTLRQLVIATLPGVHGSPRTQQQAANLRAQGLPPFEEVHEAPQIEMQLEQMIGRLIRSSEDCGRVSIIDPSIKEYRWRTRLNAALTRFEGCAGVSELTA